MKGLLSLVNGPQTFGNSRGFWFCAVIGLLIAAGYPMGGDSYAVGNLAYFGIWLFMALG